MFDLLIVDTTADSRNRICDQLMRFQSEVIQKSSGAPQISLRPAALQELTYLNSPDFVVIGQKLLAQDLVEIATVRKIFPDAKLIAEVSPEISSLVVAEQMARLGIDDTYESETSASDFFRKLIVLGKKEKKGRVGTLLVVDAGKGGAGVTSIVATMGELLRSQGKKVCLIDLDTDTQDLTRFLQVRPTINENLTAILDGEKSVVKEMLEQTYVAIDDDSDFVCVAPPVHNLFTEDNRTLMVRSFISVIEQLDQQFDIVLVDIAGLRGALHTALQKIADTYFVVANPDIASVFATIQTIKMVLSRSLSTDDVRIIFNARTVHGIPLAMAIDEILAATKLSNANVVDTLIPFCQAMLAWPASGESLLCGSRKTFSRMVAVILEHRFLLEKPLTGKGIPKNTAVVAPRQTSYRMELVRSAVQRVHKAMMSSRVIKAKPILSFNGFAEKPAQNPGKLTLPAPNEASTAPSIEPPMISVPVIE